jgi:hypothetical protein
MPATAKIADLLSAHLVGLRQNYCDAGNRDDRKLRSDDLISAAL